ncbi:ThiF family adenylyltransferase [Nocardia sp. NPDC001965]
MVSRSAAHDSTRPLGRTGITAQIRPVSNLSDADSWHVCTFQLRRDLSEHADILRRIRQLRARILYDNGRRPDFRESGGGFADNEDLDYDAWHFLVGAEPGGPISGYVRLCTPAAGHLFHARTYLGESDYANMLAGQGFDPATTFEHSRLVVEHRSRKLGLGIFLNALAIGAARHLGAHAMVGTSGTKDGQDRFHERFGFRRIEGTRRYVDNYTEDVVVMAARTAAGADEYEDLVRRLADRFPAFVTTDPPVWDETHDPVPSGPAIAIPADNADRDTWQPVLFAPADPDSRAELAALLDSGQVHSVHDTIRSQLADLIRSREPGRRFTPAQLNAGIVEQLDGADISDYGTWAWYPWSGKLVHILPRREFRLMRTDRNREKITRSDQRRLLDRRIGIVGLSVGNSAALTLALEGVGGAYRLADFDEFELSNLNRLRAGVAAVGVNKAIITARQMFEIDPYLDIEIFTAGLTDGNLAEFFDGGSGPVDLLVEECDTAYVKVAAREQARARRLPVVMDCNDRGMLDIERFDLEPSRPLLHGRLGDLGSADIRDATGAQEVELILTMVDVANASPAITESLDRIGHTLSSWPQLASGVTLGGALVTDAARRILLDQPCGSGRYYIDLDEQLAPARNTAPR